MADLKTTSTKRATVRGAVGAWQHDDALAAMDALDDLDTLLAEVERLRALSAEARDMLRDMPWRRGGDALVDRLARAATRAP